jgi:hypothetical protein
MSNNIEVQGVKRRPKGILIPVDEYDHPPTAFEDENHRYVAGANGHYLRLTKKTCNVCGGRVAFVPISHGNGYARLERFCKEHARTHGPIIPVKLKVEK